MSAPTLTAERVAEAFDVPLGIFVPLPEPQVSKETTAADLQATADVLERDGWFQGEYHCEKPGGGLTHCTLGAIGIATGFHIPGPPPDLDPEQAGLYDPEYLLHHNSADEAVRARFNRAAEGMRDYLKAFDLQEYGDVAEWNDETEGLTGEAVATTVRAAAEWVASR